MTTVAEIQKKLKQFDTTARKATNEDGMKSAWESVFHSDLSDESAKSFTQYYRDMAGKRTQRGGSAPLNYQMTPGAFVKTFANFPTEAATDAASIRNMDVYFHSGLSDKCGIEDSTPVVPASIGTNQVGGAKMTGEIRRMRTQRNRRGNRKVQSRKGRKASRKSRSQKRRTQRGGQLLDSLQSRPYLASAPYGVLQSVGNSWAGAAPAPSADPIARVWNYNTNGQETMFDPNAVAKIGADMTRLASPPPWTTQN